MSDRKINGFIKSCIGRSNMYSKSTLKSFTKEELIELLFLAEKNYQALSETYETSIANTNRIIEGYDKAFKKATDLLDEATGDCYLPCPMEYLGRCACTTTDNGFECPDDTNANWAFAISEMIKEKEQERN